MDEQQVRLLVRQAIARHMGVASAPATPGSHVAPAPLPMLPAAAPASTTLSFARFHLIRPAGETECLIEPTVTCNHCGHCQCYGH